MQKKTLETVEENPKSVFCGECYSGTKKEKGRIQTGIILKSLWKNEKVEKLQSSKL